MGLQDGQEGLFERLYLRSFRESEYARQVVGRGCRVLDTVQIQAGLLEGEFLGLVFRFYVRFFATLRMTGTFHQLFEHVIFDALQAGGFGEAVHIGFHAVAFVQLCGQAKGAQRRQPAVVQGIGEAETTNAHALFDQVAQLLFQHVERRHVGFGLAFLRLRLGEGFFVHFLVHVQGYGVNLHGDGGDHVRRFFAGDELIQLLDVHIIVAHDVGGQELAGARSGLVEGLYGNILDAGEFPYHGFHFLELDAETADFHLTVFSAHEFYRPVGPLPHNVSGAVYPGVSRIFVEGVGQEGFGRFVGPVEVAVTHLLSRKPELAVLPRRHLLAIFVYDIGVDAGEGNADRDVLLLHLHFFAHNIAAAFRGTVTVEQAVVGKRESGHLFTAGIHHLEPLAVRIIDGELGGYLGGHEAVREAVFFKEFVQPRQVQTYLFRDDIQRSTGHQSPVQVPHKGIEAKTGVGRHPGILPEAHVGGVALGKQGHVAEGKHTTLGRTGGAAGV